MHKRGSGEAARRAKRGRPLPSPAISHASGHLRVYRFARLTTEKKRLLVVYLLSYDHLDEARS